MSDARKDALITSFICTFCKYGLDGTTTKRLAEAAGISEGGIYVYFKNKEDIILQCVKTHFETVREDTTNLYNKYGGRFDELIFGIFNYVKSMLSENRFMLQVFSHPHYSTVIRDLRDEHILSAAKCPIPEHVAVDARTWQALVMLCNSALNNYILTKDEQSCTTQLNFIIEYLGLKK